MKQLFLIRVGLLYDIGFSFTRVSKDGIITSHMEARNFSFTAKKRKKTKAMLLSVSKK